MLRSVVSLSGGEFYSPVVLGPETVMRQATAASSIRDVASILRRLEADRYVEFLLGYYEAGLRQFGDDWYYADVCSALHAAATLIQPSTYLEIGVRRGRSMAMVASIAPEATLIGFDLWTPNYASMPNPGPDFVHKEMARLGHRGRLELVSGDSHVTVPRYLAEHRALELDLICVDGDHSYAGALRDLDAVLPALALGGVVVFDDICHPQHPYLAEVWRRAVERDGGLVSREFAELGYGVAVAVRTRPRASEPEDATPLHRLLRTLRSLRSRLTS